MIPVRCFSPVERTLGGFGFYMLGGHTPITKSPGRSQFHNAFSHFAYSPPTPFFKESGAQDLLILPPFLPAPFFFALLI